MADLRSLLTAGYQALSAHKAAERQCGAKTRAILTERFPYCFMPKGSQHKRPLKREIRADLVAACPDITEHDIELALRDYTGGPTYHRAMLEGEPRVALDGLLVGLVTADEAEYHRGALGRLRTSWRRRRTKLRNRAIKVLAWCEAMDAKDMQEQAQEDQRATPRAG